MSDPRGGYRLSSCFTPQGRFISKVEKVPGGCWNWTGALVVAGYGVMSLNRRREFGHRFSYEMYVGPIPAGFHIDHLCRNRRCVNPEHLEAVTPAENIRRSNAPSAVAQRTNRCIRNHDLTNPANVYIRREGNRMCRPCGATRQRDRRAAA